MRRSTTIGLTGCVGVLVALAVFSDRDNPHPDRDDIDATTPTAPAVVAQGSPQAQGNERSTVDDEALRRYHAADQAGRRALLARWADEATPALAQARILSALGADGSPIGDDPLASEAAGILAQRMGDPVAFELARTAMLTERDAKRRWVLVSSLLEYGATLADGPGPRQQAMNLATDLIDVYFDDPGAPIRTRIRDGIGAVAGEEIAVVLAAGPNVSPDALSSVMQEREASKRALAQAGTHPTL
ncbi:MAG: hypothetical protein K0V04_38520 [Deltaproteobacteria bacterium]|nr:hypothetical protein [Deltaproteobacteria bacterium]